MFSGGAINFANPGSKMIAEDTVKEQKKTPFITSLDKIQWPNMPSYIAQGFNTIIYTANGFYGNAGTQFGDTDAMYHLVTGGEFNLTNGWDIYGTVTADSITLANPIKILDTDSTGATGKYGQAFINNLSLNQANKVKAERGVYAKDLFIGNKTDSLTALNDTVIMGGADQGVYNPANNTYNGVLDGINDSPYEITLDTDRYIGFSGYIYLANDTTQRKYVIGYDATSPTDNWIYHVDATGNLIDKQPIRIKDSNASLTTFGKIEKTAVPKIAVDYYGDMDGDGVDTDGDGILDSGLDYTMTSDFQKEITMPFDFVDSSGNKIGTTNANKIQIDTAQSLYKDYFSHVVYGTGPGVDGDGINPATADGLVDYGGDGAIVAVYTTDSNADGILDSNPKDVYYGVLDGNYAPDTGTAYNPAMTSYQSIGYAKTGNTTYAGVMDGVLTAAQRLKDVDSIGDGTTLNIYPSTFATVDETPGTGSFMISYYGGGSVTAPISYSGRITSSGKLPDSVFCATDKGAKVYLVDTMGADITLQLPLDKTNIMLVSTGAGKLNLIVPDQPPPTPGNSNTALKLGNWEIKNAFIAVSSETYCMSGLKTYVNSYDEWIGGTQYFRNYGMISGIDNSAGGIYTAGTNASSPTDVGKISMYVGNNVDVEFLKGSFIGGTVYAPQSKVTMSGGDDFAPESTVYFNPPSDGSTPDANHQTTINNHIAGNVVCSGYYTSNKAGVMFLPSVTAPTPGLPEFSWKSTRYLPGN
jgi:hypothetical protein